MDKENIIYALVFYQGKIKNNMKKKNYEKYEGKLNRENEMQMNTKVLNI